MIYARLVHTRFEHACHCGEAVFWSQIAFEPEFDRRLFLDVLGYESFEVESFHETANHIRRVVIGSPRITRHVPEASRRLLSRGLRYREVDLFDKRARRCRTTIDPIGYFRRLSIAIETTTHALGPNQCRCIYDIDVTASILARLGGNSAFGIGRVIENEIIKQLVEGFGERARLTNRFINERGLGAPLPSAG